MGDLELATKRQAAAEARALHQGCDVFEELGDCYFERGDARKAGECYERAVFLRPERTGGYVGLGRLALQAGEIDRARECFRQAREKNADSAEAHAGLAAVAESEQNLSGAFDLYRRSLELDGDNLGALEAFFDVSCRVGELSQVRLLLQGYLQRHPGDTTALLYSARVHFKEGKLQETRTALTTLLTLQPDNEAATKLLEEVEEVH